MPSSERRSSTRVLVVETHDVVARECLAVLKKVNLLDPQRVASATSALERLSAWNPQLLIVGEDVEGLCGLDLCTQIRQRSTVPLILLTTWPDSAHHVRCLNAGADDAIVYPFEPSLLLARVLALMRRAYRYSVPPQAQASQGAPQFQQSGAPRHSTHSQWPRCAKCGYLGPREKFELKIGERISLQCPACGEDSRIVHPLG